MMSEDPNMHCRHERCCQCGAVRGTPEHAIECPDAVTFAKLHAAAVKRQSRKLSKR